MDGHGELLNWYAFEPREGGGLALAYDVGDGRIDAPAVHVNVNAAKAFDIEGFFFHVGRLDAMALYHGFAKRLPQGWHIWYFGVHPGRPGAPVRVDCFVDEALKRVYAAEPARLEEDLQKLDLPSKARRCDASAPKWLRLPLAWSFSSTSSPTGQSGEPWAFPPSFPLWPRARHACFGSLPEKQRNSWNSPRTHVLPTPDGAVFGTPFSRRWCKTTTTCKRSTASLCL